MTYCSDACFAIFFFLNKWGCRQALFERRGEAPPAVEGSTRWIVPDSITDVTGVDDVPVYPPRRELLVRGNRIKL